ncbi:unnamed protein product [Moneuplotes crassus]|uniref:Uncharacterized protein n=1 Tax=Euplotes crassus TaxID=5936 RepID=A0AAD1UPT2_EUPCR|nr:unnamed protein product [Moneuplotes crassus]
MNYSSVLSLSSKGGDQPKTGYKAHVSHSSTPSKKSSSESSLDRISKSRNHFEVELLDNENEKFLQDSSSFMDKKYNFDAREVQVKNRVRDYAVTALNVVWTAVAYLALALSMFLSNYVYSINKLNPWEDIYGKSLVGVMLSYLLMRVQGISPFELYSHIRVRIFVMEAIFITALCLIMYGVQQVSILTSASCLILFFVFTDHYFGLTNIFIFMAIVGLTVLANPFGILRAGQNQEIPVICLALGSILLVLGRNSSDYVRQCLPISTGTFYFYLLCVMVVPALMIASFSIGSVQISYGFFEIGYFLVNGTLTWFAIWLVVKVMSFDKENYLETLAYTIIVYSILLTMIVNKYKTNDGSGETEPQQGQSPSSPEVAPTSEGVADLGFWEYLGIAVMIGLRFVYSVYKMAKY